MPDQFTIGVLDRIKELTESRLRRFAKARPFVRYADVRLSVSQGSGAFCENGEEKYSGTDYSFSYGARVLAGEHLAAAGYFGLTLGKDALARFAAILEDGLIHAYERALCNARSKHLAKQRFGPLGECLWDMTLAPVEAARESVPAEYEISPVRITPQSISSHLKEISKELAALDRRILYNQVGASTMLEREFFTSSEGAAIDQTFAITHGMAYVVASGKEGIQEHYDDIGHQRGWEVIEKGCAGPFIHSRDLRSFSLELARESLELADAPPLRDTGKAVTVVTDPHFNALLVHEIIGHPTELDRALKMETAYAGRSWLLHDLEHNQIGRQIASPLLSAYSDPSLPGFGHYRYDHEGTRGRKVYHIENGTHRGFMNSRQTAAVFGDEPNGSYTSVDASLVPLIRMSTTVIENGARDSRDILGEIDHGYYLVGHRIPSIAESRENFRITARKVYEITNGAPGRLFRDGGITADSRDFLMQVDAVGNDFRIFPISNCGKGQPMQSKKLGNGGPTLRSRARLTGTSG
jgi:TldD protein